MSTVNCIRPRRSLCWFHVFIGVAIYMHIPWVLVGILLLRG